MTFSILKNSILIFLVRIYRKWAPPPPFPSDKKNLRILIVSTTGLGDTLWATPAIRAIKQHLPHCSLSVLTHSMGKELLKGNPYVDNIFILKKQFFPSFFHLLKRLKKERFHLVFLFHASQRLVFPICALTNAPLFIGIEGRNKGLDSLFTYFEKKSSIHEILQRLQLLKPLNIPTSVSPFMELFLEEAEKKKVAASLPPLRPLIALHPGAADRYKCWPKEYFILLGKLLQEKLHATLLITGVPREKALVEEILSHLPQAKGMYHLPLREFLALIGEVDLLVCNDTGPLHIACALQRPVVALFGPTSSEICGPYQVKTAHVLHGEKTCPSCLRRRCPQPHCLAQLSPEEVLKKVEEVLSL